MLDWNAPSTWDLTKIVRDTEFNLRNSDTKITEFIYQKLIDNGYSEAEVNFETIINVIEELIVYYSEFNTETQTPSLLAAFTLAKYEVEMLNYSIKGGNRVPGYQLQIPEGVDYKFAKHAANGENPNQFFFQHLLAVVLSGIVGRISKYAYHTSSSSVIEKESPISSLFRQWIKNFKHGSLLRLYTLNYDRIYKILLQEEGINCFEGFDSCESIKPGEELKANIQKILNNFDCNVYYNLHGSAFWRVKSKGRRSSNPEIVFCGYPDLAMNYNGSMVEVEKGKPVMLSNIVTGYQKAQRAMLTPYKQMQAAFDRDCCTADKITIIGYSFGDEHINQSIRSAMQYNQKVIIEIVDPSFIESKKDHEFALRFLPYYDLPPGTRKLEKINDNLYTYNNGRFKVHTLKFKEYLELQSG